MPDRPNSDGSKRDTLGTLGTLGTDRGQADRGQADRGQACTDLGSARTRDGAEPM